MILPGEQLLTIQVVDQAGSACDCDPAPWNAQAVLMLCSCCAQAVHIASKAGETLQEPAGYARAGLAGSEY
eukprot:1159641-Pelagomonas_calceolata.AAC.3